MKGVDEKSAVTEAVEFWQGRTDVRLSDADGQEIVTNICGFFQVLAEWDRASRKPRRNKE